MHQARRAARRWWNGGARALCLRLLARAAPSPAAAALFEAAFAAAT
jgi:hypothetical protein